MDISNKTLAWLVVVAIVVSIFGTTISILNLSNRQNALVAYATSNTTGGASAEVSQSVILRFAINATDFGQGSVNSSIGYWGCVLAINGSTANPTIIKDGCSGFSATSPALVIENVGTSYLNVTLNFSRNATDFLSVSSGTVGNFKYVVSNNESGSCTPVGWLNATTTAWTEVGVPNTTTVVCQNLSWAGSGNSLVIGLNLTVTDNVTQGAKFMWITAQGTNN
jgi:hypothetical protein